jgi:DNA mismatch repair ATPase MutS
VQCVFLAENWQQKYGAHIRGWLDAVGEFEALTALAGYAFEHPNDVLPEFVEHGPLLEAEGITHPLLPVEKAVRNDVKLGEQLQLIVLSGPNMAGKSTFIRSLGINAVLAQCGAPVRARALRMSPLAVAASICVLDSLSGGTSRFYAEIRRLKVAEDLSAGPVPVFFLMDELLSGTNSHDRLEGTKLVVQSLIDRGAIGIVSTHDLALAEIPATLHGRALNCHFEDRIEDGKLIFDYKIMPGVVKTSNALELMRSIGLGASRVVD